MIPSQFRLIATSASIVREVGPSGAIWLGNALSAQEWSEKEYKDSWWHATKADIEERTGLSAEMQETARKRLRDLGVLEEKRGILKRGASLATIWYCVSIDKLSSIVCRESRQTGAESHRNRLPCITANDHASLTSSLNTQAATSSPPAPEAPPKHRKQRPQFQEPTLEEWMAFCHEKWPWMTPIHAEQSWNHYHLGAVDGQWVQKDGTPIKSWRQCANTSHGLFIASNPDAKARYHRIQQTAARASESAQKPAESGWRNSPEWFAHVERCKAEGKSMQETLLTFTPGEKA